MKEYVPARETSYKGDIPEIRVRKLCRARCIPGLECFGRLRAVQATAWNSFDLIHNTHINFGKEAAHADKQ